MCRLRLSVLALFLCLASGTVGTTSLSAATTAVPPTDLAVTVTASNVPKAGAPYTLTTHVTNLGTAAAHNAYVDFQRLSGDTLPFETGAFQPWPCHKVVGGGPYIRCEAQEDLAAGASADVTATPWSDPNATSDTVLVSAGMSNDDSNPANNVLTVVTPMSIAIVPAPAMTAASAYPFLVGTDYDVKCEVRTDGPSAHDYTLVYDTPPHTVFRAISQLNGMTCTTPPVDAPGRVTCSAALLPGNRQNAPARWAVVIRLRTDTPGTVTHSFTANASNFANGAVTSSFTGSVANEVIQFDARLFSPTDARPGEVGTFSILLTNKTAWRASAITIDVALPPGAVLKGESCSGTHCVFPGIEAYMTDEEFFGVQFPAAGGKATYSVTLGGPAVIPQTLSADVNVAVADVRLSSTLTPAAPRVAPGGHVNLTVAVKNSGTVRSSPVTITATIPSNLQVTSVSGSGATCSPAPQVNCTFASIGAGATESISFSAQASTTLGTAIVTTSVTSPNATVPQQTATVNITPPVSELTASIFSDHTTVAPNGQVVYSLGIINNGPDNAPDVAVELTPHGAKSIASVSSNDFSCTQQAPIRCVMPLLTLGRGADIFVRVDAPATAGTMSLDTTITSPASGAKTLTVATPVVATPPSTQLADLVTRVLATNGTVNPGQLFTTSFSVENSGGAAPATFDVWLSAGLQLVQLYTTRGNCTGAHCDLGTLGTAQSATIGVITTATRSGTASIGATASTSSQQSSRDNDTVDAIINVAFPRNRAARH